MQPASIPRRNAQNVPRIIPPCRFPLRLCMNNDNALNNNSTIILKRNARHAQKSESAERYIKDAKLLLLLATQNGYPVVSVFLLVR
jgi:hypothetical protein